EVIIEKKLCACISLVPVRSFYSWNNKLEDHEEIMVLFKTTKSLATKLKLEIARIHPYDVPEIIEMKMSDVAKSYLKWMIESIKS
ncbi:MAG: divalent-cation tolerance protein CutA, partial [Nitrososphaerales archaeon]